MPPLVFVSSSLGYELAAVVVVACCFVLPRSIMNLIMAGMERSIDVPRFSRYHRTKDWSCQSRSDWIATLSSNIRGDKIVYYLSIVVAAKPLFCCCTCTILAMW
jgi:hypothetical protein